MKIAVLGAGGIGSTFVVQLVKASHEVTVVARGARLEQLDRAGGVATLGGSTARARVAAALPTDEAFDLVLVSVLASQVDAVLPALAKSAARRIMFMFNTFEPLDRLRDAVGSERFTFGFPSILARVDEHGLLHADIQRRGMLTTVTDGALARVFSSAGIPTVVTEDMVSWLRAHAAAIVPFMLAVGEAHASKAGISWQKADLLAEAMAEGFALVRALGHSLIPPEVAVLSRLPRAAVALALWTATRAPSLRAMGAGGMREPVALIDAMVATAQTDLPALRSVRPDLPTEH